MYEGLNMRNSKEEYISKIKILVVEDEIESLERLTAILKLNYSNTITATNGKDGYDRYLDFSPDIVITDIRMPIMDGLEMSALIKQKNKDAQIIIVSAFTERRYLKQAINLGISKYVTKPLSNMLLFDNIKEITTNLYHKYELSKKFYELELANKKYKKEKKRAEVLQHIANESNKAKSMFLANMSHEIRTPLNAIQGFIDILIEEENDTRKISHLDIVHRNGQSLLQIINDILDFSKIESGKLDIDKQMYNLYEQIDSIVSLFCAKATQRKIIFSVYIEPNIPKEFYSDDLRIRQIISNLLSNAIKFTDEKGTISLDITSDVQNQTIKFSVKDSGRGISEKYLKTIFDSFTQEDNSITKNFGGTGLGLAISYKLADMLGGELKVKSEFGIGSEFYFILPINNLKTVEQIYTQEKISSLSSLHVAIIYPENEKIKIDVIKQYFNTFKITQIAEFNNVYKERLKEFDYIFIFSALLNEDIKLFLEKLDNPIVVLKSKIDISSHLKGNFKELVFPLTASNIFDILIGTVDDKEVQKGLVEQDIDFKGKRILLVEDNKSNQQFMIIILKKLGFIFDIAQDGIDAINMFSTNSYDLILMDENMPNMDGIEATKKIIEIEEIKRLKHTPIVALTANALKGDKEKFIKAGMDEYLTKPLNKKKLIDILRGLIE